jgi:hypothetical protein
MFIRVPCSARARSIERSLENIDLALTAGANASSEPTPETLNALQPSWTFLPGLGTEDRLCLLARPAIDATSMHGSSYK